MKKLLITTIAITTLAISSFAQTYKTRDGQLFFNPNKNQSNKEYAALSKEATAIFKVDDGSVALLVPMKSFRFNNALLEEHFNENYLHSNKFPNATYKGTLTGFNKAMLAKDGEYNMSSQGEVEMHGVKQKFTAPVKLTVKNKVATFQCQFNVKAEDYKIDIPAIVKPKLSENTPLSATINFKM